MLSALVNVGNYLRDWFKIVLTSLSSGDLHSLLPLFVIGIAISLVIVIFKLIRKITWGS